MERKGMTPFERKVKYWIIHDILDRNGYKSYAKHLVNYDLYLTRDPSIAACVNPYKGYIKLNMYFDDPDDISMLIRHELLHELLHHKKKSIVHICKKLGLDPHHLSRSNYNIVKSIAFGKLRIPTLDGYGKVSILNVAGDWDLSRYYSEEELTRAKKSLFYGKEMEALVLELDHPEWAKLSFEELYDKLEDIVTKEMIDGADVVEGNLEDDLTFIPDMVEEHTDDIRKVEKETTANSFEDTDIDKEQPLDEI